MNIAGGCSLDRRTRIVATLGPASEPVLDALLRAGVDVVRINFSHGEPGEHMRRIAAVRDAARRCGRVVAVLADLPGPKLRVRLAGPLVLKSSDEVSIAALPDATADIAV